MEKIIESQSGKFIIRPYRIEDEKGVLELWETAFGKKMSPELWQWKYTKNPYGYNIVLCVSENGDTVAMYAGIPYVANWQGKNIRMTHPMDSMSNPRYRSVLSGKGGLFFKTADVFFENYGGEHASVFMYGFPGKKVFTLGGKILKYVKIEGGTAYMTASPADVTQKTLPFYGKIERLTQIKKLNQLAEEYRKHYPLSVLRDEKFITWRFDNHPENSYEIWSYVSYFYKRLKGYIVLSFKGEKAVIIDIFMPPSEKSLKDFIIRLSRVLAEKGITQIETWLPAGHFLTRGLLSSGFRTFQEPLGIIPVTRTFYSQMSSEWACENLFYTMADADLF
jgi:hypothetical protein